MRDEEKVAKPPQLAQTVWWGQELFDHTTPSAPQRRLRYFFLMSRPPLLLLRRGAAQLSKPHCNLANGR
jgi:hypothetical protein